MFHQILLSPQVKRCAIITDEQGIYDLPHKLLNDLSCRILEKIRKIIKSKPHRIIT